MEKLAGLLGTFSGKGNSEDGSCTKSNPPEETSGGLDASGARREDYQATKRPQSKLIAAATSSGHSADTSPRGALIPGVHWCER